jgi:hypothetical protein
MEVMPRAGPGDPGDPPAGGTPSIPESPGCQRESAMTRRRHGSIGLLAVLAAALAAPPARAQFLDAAAAGGTALGDARTVKYRVGFEVTAEGGPCSGIYATLPVPTDWPEQKVRIAAEDVSPAVRSLRYRTLPGGLKQMVVEIPDLPTGKTARAVVTFELERHALVAPTDTAGLRIPAKPDRALKAFLGPSPYIESRDPKIVALAKAAGEELEGWRKVEAIYDTVRDKVEYRNGELKGARRALADGWGDCEELTCLFIAMARAEGIPARTVWVEGHCYPEFYLEDDTGKGWWFPCQAAGTRAFGGMPDQLPILQKGDSFRDPDRPGKTLRYVAEFLKGSTTKGGGDPRVVWIREGA